MKYTTLYHKFHEAIRWNGVLFLIKNASKTLLTLLLFAKLSTTDFATWANVFSMVFIFALWTDLGFLKSLPLFCPIVAQNQQAKQRFIRGVILFKLLLSLCANLLLFIIVPYCAHVLNLGTNLRFFYLGCALFFGESIKSTLRLLFHSYFWQRQFNVVESVVISCKTGVLLLFMLWRISGSALLNGIFFCEIIAQFFIICCAIIMLKYLFSDTNYQGNIPVNLTSLIKSFSIHSGIMWSLISLNSLTERNVLIPFFTALIGPAAANIFKVANDMALLFQRFVLKTIGTTDTSLLAHINVRQNLPRANDVQTINVQQKILESPQDAEVFQNAFTTLSKKVITLTVPLFGIIPLIYLYTISQQYITTSHFFFTNYHPLIVPLFLLLVGCYLFQIFFLAYDRLLEVKQRYFELFISALPYLFIIILFIGSLRYYRYYFLLKSLIPFIIFIHGLRIVSLLLRVFFVRKNYTVVFPFRFFVFMLSCTCLVSTTVFFLAKIFFPVP